MNMNNGLQQPSAGLKYFYELSDYFSKKAADALRELIVENEKLTSVGQTNCQWY